MKSQVDHKVLGNFFDYDQTELDFSEVTHNVSNHDKDYCIDVILKYFRKYGFPYYTVTEDEKYKHMNQLSKFDTNELLKEDDRIEQTMHALRLAWTYFEPHFWNVPCGNAKMTPWEMFHDDDAFKKVLRKTWIYHTKFEKNKFSENRVRQCLKMYGGTQAVSNFRPTAAKYIYETYGGIDGVVWDMSTGWGGRLIGALSTSNIKKYIGTEPSTETFNGLKQIQKDFSYIDKEVELHKLGSEVFRPKEKVDLCFTSPPYFDTEKYSDEPTQSYIKYPTQDEWIDGFLYLTIENCYESLKKNGYLLLNIANTSKGKTIEEGTLRIAKDLGFVHEKTLQLSLSTLAKGGDGTGFKYEPIFVFKRI